MHVACLRNVTFARMYARSQTRSEFSSRFQLQYYVRSRMLRMYHLPRPREPSEGFSNHSKLLSKSDSGDGRVILLAQQTPSLLLLLRLWYRCRGSHRGFGQDGRALVDGSFSQFPGRTCVESVEDVLFYIHHWLWSNRYAFGVSWHFEVI